MRASIDSLGRVVVPKSIRDRLRLRGGELLEIEERDGVIELRPAAADVTIVQTPEGPVAAPVEDVAPLSTELVRDVVEQVRR
jgi:AbrB family looped-hinge helix DNA binding protein